MRKDVRAAALVLAFLGLGILAGIGHAQRFASKEPIPGSLPPDEKAADLDVWKWLNPYSDGEKDEFGPQWRAKIKEDLIQSKPNLRALAEKKRDAARKVLHGQLTNWLLGRSTMPDFLIEASKRSLEADLDLCATKEERIRAFEEQWDLFKLLESRSQKKFDEGWMSPSSHYPIVHARAKAEFDLAKAMAD
jgi:hypothetical protein